MAKSSHGSSAMAAIPLISSGSSVSLAASKGMAVRAMPSPRLLAMLAVKRFTKAGPSPRFGAVAAGAASPAAAVPAGVPVPGAPPVLRRRPRRRLPRFGYHLGWICSRSSRS